ncbi:histidine kinase [Chloroflexota bacterium]
MEQKLLLFRAVLCTSLLWGVQFYYFVRSFLRLSGGFGTWLGYVSLVLFTTLATLGYIPPGITFNGGAIDPVYGWWIILYAGTFIALAVLGVHSLVKRLKIVDDPRERNKIAYLITAVGILVVFGFSSMTPLSDEFPVSLVGALLSASILTYAVMKHDLVSINAVLRRSLGWVSLSALSIGAYLLVFYILNSVVGFDVEPNTLALVILLAAAMTVFVYRLRPIFGIVIDRLFFHGTYPYRQALLGFNSKMGNIIDLSDLADEMLPAICMALRTSHARLLLEETNSGDFTSQFTYPKVNNKSSYGLRIKPDNPVITWLEKENIPLDLKQIDNIPQFKALWQTEKEKLTNSNLELLCPLKSRGRLIGILALGRKQSGTLYSHEDILLVMSLTGQAGVVIENAKMFDSLQKQQLQVEQLLTQAVLAQEEERERISVDLHDSVAQWLAAASYRAQTASAFLLANQNTEAQAELTVMESTIDKSLKELRRVVIDLRPPALDELGLTHSLRQSLEDLKPYGLKCKYNEIGTPVRLPSSIEIAVYRIVQETLTNIHKHAKATEVHLRLQYKENKFLVEVRDDGKGFDLPRTLDSAISIGHVGLLGMKQRVEMLDGDIRIITSEGAGTAIILSLPINPKKGKDK